MAEKKRSWFFFSSGDAPAVRQRLNCLAQQGWELDESEDCTAFFVCLRATARKELRYDVVRARAGRTQEELHEEIQRRIAQGWKPVATINGMDVYASEPCALPEPDKKSITRKNLLWGQLPGLLLAAAFLAVLFWMERVGGGHWYLQHRGAFLHFALYPAVIGLGLWALWFGLRYASPERVSVGLMWLHSAVAVLGLVWLWLLLGAYVLDWLPDVLAVALVLGVTGLLIYYQIRWSRRSGELYRPMVLLILGVFIVLTAALRQALPDPAGENVQMLSARDFGLIAGELELAEAKGTGSFFVDRVTYSESWSGDLYLSEELYLCRTEALAKQVAADLCEDLGITPAELWYSENGSKMLVRQNNQVLKLWISDTDLRTEEMQKTVEAYLAR